MVSAAVVPGDPPPHPIPARGLVRDLEGPWLIVYPVGDERWHPPGGPDEQNEAPSDACRRDIREELGVDLESRRLCAVGWNPPRQPGHRARVTFIFGPGAHDASDITLRIRLQENELEDLRWAAPTVALDTFHPAMSERLEAWQAQVPSAVYVQHPPPGPAS